MKKRQPHLCVRHLAGALALITASVLIWDRHVAAVGRRRLVTAQDAPHVDAIVVPGAKVFASGRPCLMLQDRLTVALRLYRAGLAPTIVVSGDNRALSHHETAAMRAYLERFGVAPNAIIEDTIGYDTFATVQHLKETYSLASSMMTTQTFHLERALYLARCLGVTMVGVSTDLHAYRKGRVMRLRERPARLKCLWDVMRHRVLTATRSR